MAMRIEDVSGRQMKERKSEGALLGALYATVRTVGALTNIGHPHVPARTNDVAESG